GEVGVGLCSACSVTDALELFDRPPVARDRLYEAPALELDHRQVPETVSDLLDAACLLRKLEPVPQVGGGVVELTPGAVCVAKQSQRRRDPVRVARVFEDALRLQLVAQCRRGVAAEGLGARELEQQTSDDRIPTALEGEQGRLKHVGGLLDATGNGKCPALLEPERRQIGPPQRVRAEGV